MALPTFVAAGASFASTSNVTAFYPAGRAVDDLLLLFVETADQTAPTPTGWTKIGEISNSGQTRLTVFSLRYASGSAITVASSGDHQLGGIIAIRGAKHVPHLVVTDSGTESGANQTQNMDGDTTSLNDCFIVIATSHGNDILSSTNYSSWTNANLANVTERFDFSSTQGNGGGVGIATGELATAGAIGTSTVVNAATSPAWTSMVLAFPPTDPPVNDNFVNAELLVDGATQAVQGSTFDATTEAGEDLSSYLAETSDRTQWWTYDAAVRQIVTYRIVPTINNAGLILQTLRGPSVNSTSRYSAAAINQVSGDVPTTFGAEEERGLLYEWQISQTSGVFNRAQIDPVTPLFLQTGRRAQASFADQLYEIEFYSFTPPANDDFVDAEEIDVPDLDPIDITYDLEPATAQPGFDPPVSFVQIGDLWYHLYLASDTPIGMGIVKDDIGDNTWGIYAAVWSGDDLESLTYAGAVFGSYIGESDPDIAQINFTGGVNYYIQILDQPRSGILNTQTGTLHLQPYEIPPNDDFADAEDLGTADSGSTGVATTLGSSVEVDEPYSGGFSVWYEFTPTNSGWYEFTVGNAPDSWGLSAYRGVAVDALTYVSGIGFIGGDTKALALRGGETYKIQLGGTSFDFGTLAWNLVSPAPANDDEAGATVITGASGTESSDIEGATNEATEENGFPDYVLREVTSWFEWTCPSTDFYSFETTGLGPGTDYTVALTAWETDTSGDPLCANLDGKDDDQGKLAFSATASETYLIRVTLERDFSDYPNYYTWSGPFTFDLVWDTFVPATDNLFANATLISADPVDSVITDNYGLPETLEPDFPDLDALFSDDFGAGQSQWGRARWFNFVPEHTGTYDFFLVANGSSMLMHVFTGTSLVDLVTMTPSNGGTGNGTSGAYADYGSSEDNGTSPLTLDLVEGETYWIVVAGLLWENSGQVPAYWISQADFTLSWGLHPSENDIYADVRSLSGSNDNIGNLDYYDAYSYGGVDYSPYGLSFGSGGCRTVSNLAATAESGEPAILGFGPTRTLWFLVRPLGVDDYALSEGDYKFWVEGVGPTPCLDPLLAVYEWQNDVSSLGAPLGSDDDTNGLYPEVIVNDLPQFDALMIQVDARDEGDFRLHWQRVPPGALPANDDFANATNIDALVATDTPFTVDVVNATVECGETLVAGFWDGPYGSVWYEWNSLVDQAVSVTVDTTGIDPDLDYQLFDVFEGTTLDDLVNVTPADDFDNFSYDEVTVLEFIAEGGKTYYFRFSAYADQGWDSTQVTISAFGDNIFPPRIGPNTTLFTPTLQASGDVPISVPFIAATGSAFAPYIMGPIDIPAPFIGPTSSAEAPRLIGPNRVRVTQEAVEVLVQGISQARLTQEPVEVVVKGESAVRLTQEPVEVLRTGESKARVTQEPVEVAVQNTFEIINVIVTDWQVADGLP